MILLEKTLDILTALVRQTWHDPLVGLLLMVAVSAVVAWRASTPHRSHRWVVRKGVCPCCGRALFGTTLAYQRLPGLALVYPESPSLNLSDFVARKICLRSRVSPRHFRANHTKSGEPQLCLLVHMHPNFDLLQTAIN
jgi:hypothetical protein